MKLWIDTEFNDFKGALISIALVDENMRTFYRALECADPAPWVADNVMPVLDTPAVPLSQLQDELQTFLSVYSEMHLIADWPEDIAHFCNVLITGPGMRLRTPPLTMEVRRDLDSSASAIPHNALADALAVRRAHLGLLA